MLIGGIDLETTGLNVEKDRITEVGFVLWDTEESKPIDIYNQLVWDETYPSLEPIIIKITGLTDGILKEHGQPPKRVFSRLIEKFSKCGYIIAHNGTGFDRPMLEANARAEGIELPATPWLDTCVDVPYPDNIATRHLNYLASEHGFLNPFRHRAVFDVLTMLAVVSNYPFEQVLAFMHAKSVKVIAVCEKPWLDNNESTNNAKSIGFRWDGALKQWQQTVKEPRLQQLKERAESLNLPLQVHQVD